MKTFGVFDRSVGLVILSVCRTGFLCRSMWQAFFLVQLHLHIIVFRRSSCCPSRQCGNGKNLLFDATYKYIYIYRVCKFVKSICFCRRGMLIIFCIYKHVQFPFSDSTAQFWRDNS